MFIRKEVPGEIQEVVLHDDGGNYNVFQLLVKIGAAKSNGEARRLVTQGGVMIDGKKVSDPNAETNPDTPFILKVGKRKFYKIRR